MDSALTCLRGNSRNWTPLLWTHNKKLLCHTRWKRSHGSKTRRRATRQSISEPHESRKELASLSCCYAGESTNKHATSTYSGRWLSKMCAFFNERSHLRCAYVRVYSHTAWNTHTQTHACARTRKKLRHVTYNTRPQRACLVTLTGLELFTRARIHTRAHTQTQPHTHTHVEIVWIIDCTHAKHHIPATVSYLLAACCSTAPCFRETSSWKNIKAWRAWTWTSAPAPRAFYFTPDSSGPDRQYLTPNSLLTIDFAWRISV